MNIGKKFTNGEIQYNSISPSTLGVISNKVSMVNFPQTSTLTDSFDCVDYQRVSVDQNQLHRQMAHLRADKDHDR